ncbi:hypothetical protein HMPREF0742_02704 [Rothia aeria F0184]|uniref:Uncharacterized protein n=1 Tax=Rothia aeria F0184 TaxID=888019 RepID=U7UUT0_9MICC|nr:hypothetical protein HMPREF0742_02704 [Rothia aeria F0184]
MVSRWGNPVRVSGIATSAYAHTGFAASGAGSRLTVPAPQPLRKNMHPHAVKDLLRVRRRWCVRAG